MPDLSLTADQPTKRQIGRREASRPLKVTGRLKQALHLMVWDGKTDSQACEATGLRLNALRMALRLPHVRTYYRDQLQVLRGRESAQNVHRLIAIRDAADNMPAVQAIKLLEQLGDEQQAPGRQQQPGLIVQVIGTATVSAAPMQPIDPQPAQPDATDRDGSEGVND